MRAWRKYPPSRNVLQPDRDREGQPSMVVYYRGPDAKITNRDIETWCPHYQHFAIAELWEVRIAEVPPGPADVRSTGLALGLFATGAVGLACLPASGGCLAMTALTAGAAVAAFHAVRLRRAEYLITTRRGDGIVCLYRTTDERVFGQVRRALARALEAYRDS
jgi:Family of unknown function (DUF6232)